MFCVQLSALVASSF